ncbi:helix-turn-helix domain-containing protein [Pseudomonas viridiflava]|uniref:Helix-turn-helix domain-containing protein n=1 Tax=Pseudomonas viridiflava TaxID=33069 RepID=A0ABU7N6Q8_PSEVI|nr:helix-turn-helix domain-containing protein [Pseudomonas viridiflava]MEE4040632.1 helix-turn-helix domain-containing protein [Pseudomonas viridiflava]MEE4060950.1 helix-turn-helix domain-containing protein [Pseudomonas viridiflava]MEE4170527.1 helix-turn-helix domain-containing protein [Pseudomonas viridiflava]
MTDKKKADQQARLEISQIKNTSINAQNARFIRRLRLGSIDTFTAMRELNICRPGARICDLRNAGYRIDTARIVLTDEWGRTHRGVALYTLMSEPRSAA